MALDAVTRWIRRLAAPIPGGGDEAEHAIEVLGLLLERERGAPTPGEEARLEQLLGLDPVRPLSPLAIHEAVSLLIAHLTSVRVPTPIVVGALVRSREPRVVPHLTALLARVLDDAAHAAVAAQVVSELTRFSDARAMAALRLAAERGPGDARAQAAAWLRARGDAPVPAPATAHAPTTSFAFAAEASWLQRRPGSAQVVINDAADALVVVDPAGGIEVSRSRLSSGFPRDSAVRQWCLSADGSEAVVFADGGVGSLVSLGSGASADLPPLDGELDDQRYLWDDHLIVAVGEVATLFGLSRTGDAATFEKLRSLEVRRDHRMWMRCNDALRPLASWVVRTEPHEHRMLGYDLSGSPAFVVLGPEANVELRVPVPQLARGVAYRPGRLFVLHDHEVQALDGEGVMAETFPAPDGSYLRALDVVGDSLIVLATRLDDPRSSLLLTYAGVGAP